MKRKLKKCDLGGDPINPFGQAPWIGMGQSNPLVNCPQGYRWSSIDAKCIPNLIQVQNTKSNYLTPAPPVIKTVNSVNDNSTDPGRSPAVEHDRREARAERDSKQRSPEREHRTDRPDRIRKESNEELHSPINDQEIQIKNKATFGNIDYGYRTLSNSIQGIAAFFREKHNRAGQKKYYQNQFNPLTYIPETGNTSEQNQFGMSYFEEGGSVNNECRDKNGNIIPCPPLINPKTDPLRPKGLGIQTQDKTSIDIPVKKKFTREEKINKSRYDDVEKANKFLNDYYSHAVDNIPFYNNLSTYDSIRAKMNFGDKNLKNVERLKSEIQVIENSKNPYSDKRWKKTDSLNYYQGYPEFVYEDKSLKKKGEDAMKIEYDKQRRLPIEDLNKPENLVFEKKPWSHKKGTTTFGEYDPKTNTIKVSDIPSRLNTITHEKAHKADRSKMTKGFDEEKEFLKSIDISKYSREDRAILQDQLEYLNQFTERQARHRTAQLWLYENFPGYDPKKPVTEKEFDFLLKNRKKLPTDINQLMALYGSNKDTFIKNINKFGSGGEINDPSIVNFLNRKGQASDKESRKQLAKQYGIEGYDFSAEKNLELLSRLRNEDKKPKTRYVKNPEQRIDLAPSSTKTAKNEIPWMYGSNTPIAKVSGAVAGSFGSKPEGEVDGKIERRNKTKGFTNHPNNYRTKSQPKSDMLESGVVVDKRTGKAVVIKDGKVTRKFDVITGENVDSNTLTGKYMIDMKKEDKVTPVGTYLMKGKGVGLFQSDIDYYNNNVQVMKPLGDTPKSKGRTNLAIHEVYDPINRRKFFGSKSPWASYGCINCKKPDIKYIMEQFPKGDTIKVVDSKNMVDNVYMKKVLNQFEGGGELDFEEEFEKELFGEPVVNKAQQPEQEEVQEEETPQQSGWIDNYLMSDRTRRTRTEGVNPDGESGDIVQAFKNGIANVESGGDYYAQAKGSSAFGKYQFTKGTLEQVRKNFFPQVKSKDFEIAYKTDPQFQEKVMDTYAKYLLSTSNTPQEAALKHFLGEAGAKKATSPTYNPGGVNMNVGSYVNKFNKGFKFEEGGEYEVDDDEIENLRSQGYDIEIL